MYKNVDDVLETWETCKMSEREIAEHFLYYQREIIRLKNHIKSLEEVIRKRSFNGEFMAK